MTRRGDVSACPDRDKTGYVSNAASSRDDVRAEGAEVEHNLVTIAQPDIARMEPTVSKSVETTTYTNSSSVCTSDGMPQ